MKKMVYVLGAFVCLCSCHVRHDHSKQMMQVHVAVDTMQKNDVEDAEPDWMDEDLVVMPQKPVHGKSPANIDETIERMMRGEEVEF